MINKVILIGNVGQDPDVRYLDDGTPVCSLRLATSEDFRNKNGERVTNTEWHTVVLWRGLAEIAKQYVKKGSQLFIEGKLRTRSWEDKEKSKRYTTEIVADVMKLLGRKQDDSDYSHSGNSEKASGYTNIEQNFAEGEGQDDDLPF